VKRRHFLGVSLQRDRLGRATNGAALQDVQRRQVISRAEYLEYERRVKARLFARRVVVACALGIVACLAASRLIHFWRSM